MPSRRRRQVELERVLGAPALFATVYGNVGSSIYYALGVTAVFALGLTPLDASAPSKRMRRSGALTPAPRPFGLVRGGFSFRHTTG